MRSFVQNPIFWKKNQSNIFCEQFQLFRFWSWVCFSDSPWRIPSVPNKKNVLYGTLKKDFCGFLCWSKELFGSLLQQLEEKDSYWSNELKKRNNFVIALCHQKKLLVFSVQFTTEIARALDQNRKKNVHFCEFVVSITKKKIVDVRFVWLNWSCWMAAS